MWAEAKLQKHCRGVNQLVSIHSRLDPFRLEGFVGFIILPVISVSAIARLWIPSNAWIGSESELQVGRRPLSLPISKFHLGNENCCSSTNNLNGYYQSLA